MLTEEDYKKFKLFIVDQVIANWTKASIESATQNDKTIIRPQRVVNTYYSWHHLIGDDKAEVTVKVIHGDIRGVQKLRIAKSKPILKKQSLYDREVAARRIRALEVGKRRISEYEKRPAKIWRKSPETGEREYIRRRRRKPRAKYEQQALGYGLRTLRDVPTHYTRRAHWRSNIDKRAIQDKKGRFKTYTKLPSFMVEENVKNAFYSAFADYAHFFIPRNTQL